VNAYSSSVGSASAVVPPCTGTKLKYYNFYKNINIDALVKSIWMAKLKIPYTRRSGFSGLK
jgi:hypothetical protein